MKKLDIHCPHCQTVDSFSFATKETWRYQYGAFATNWNAVPAHDAAFTCENCGAEFVPTPEQYRALTQAFDANFEETYSLLNATSQPAQQPVM